MKKINYLFFISLALFLTLQILVLTGTDLPIWITSYVNDFLCMPIVLTICLMVVQYIKKDNKIRIPLAPILVLTTFYALLFEAVLPHFHPRYTADWLDIPMYFAGSLLFYLFEKL